MSLLRQRVICSCNPSGNNSNIDDTINDTSNKIDDIFGSDKDLDEGEEDLSEKYKQVELLLDKFIEGLIKYLDDEFDLSDSNSEFNCNSFMNAECGPVLGVCIRDTFILESSILDNEKIVSRIKSERFIKYNHIRQLLNDFVKKLKEYDFDRLNYYTTKIDELLIVIHHYLLTFIFKVVVLNLEDNDGWNTDDNKDDDSNKDDSSNKCKCECDYCVNKNNCVKR